MKIAPYTSEELERVLAYENTGRIKRGICDWCGGPMSPTQPKVAYICHRCWGNRALIGAAIADINSVAPAPDPAHNDASTDESADNMHRGRSE